VVTLGAAPPYKRLLLTRVVRWAGGPLAFSSRPLVSSRAVQQNRNTLEATRIAEEPLEACLGTPTEAHFF